jgi:hypothetical protein
MPMSGESTPAKEASGSNSATWHTWVIGAVLLTVVAMIGWVLGGAGIAGTANQSAGSPVVFYSMEKIFEQIEPPASARTEDLLQAQNRLIQDIDAAVRLIASEAGVIILKEEAAGGFPAHLDITERVMDVVVGGGSP